MTIKASPSEQVSQSELSNLINQAKTENCKAIWLHLDNSPDAIPLAFQLNKNFQFHIAHEKKAILSLWLKGEDEINTLPPPLTHQLGVSSVCFKDLDTDQAKILLVKDKGTVKFYGDYWKLPGGRVDLFESIADASEREMFEECGVKTKFKSILGFRETLVHPNVPMNRADMFYITRCVLADPNNDKITITSQRKLNDGRIIKAEASDVFTVNLHEMQKQKYDQFSKEQEKENNNVRQRNLNSNDISYSEKSTYSKINKSLNKKEIAKRIKFSQQQSNNKHSLYSSISSQKTKTKTKNSNNSTTDGESPCDNRG